MKKKTKKVWKKKKIKQDGTSMEIYPSHLHLVFERRWK